MISAGKKYITNEFLYQTKYRVTWRKKIEKDGEKKGHSADAAISSFILLRLMTGDLSSPDKFTHSSVNLDDDKLPLTAQYTYLMFNDDDNKLTSNIHVATTLLMNGCKLEWECAM